MTEDLPIYQELETLKIECAMYQMQIEVLIKDNNNFEHKVIIDREMFKGLVLPNVILFKDRKRWHITRDKQYAKKCSNRNMINTL